MQILLFITNGRLVTRQYKLKMYVCAVAKNLDLQDRTPYAAADTGKKEYICAKKYSLLTDPTNHWTVSAGDYIVTGIADSSIKTPAELTRTYSDVYRVISVSDYRVSDSKVSDVDHIKVVVKK